MIKYAINLIKLFIYKIKYGKRISLSGIPRTHLLPKIHVAETGCITLNASFMAEKNTFIESYASGQIWIGENVFLNTNVKIVSREKIVIGDNTVIAPNVCIYDHDHDWRSENMQNQYVSKEIKIGSNVWIGANTVILKGSVIGDNAVIGAGSVIKGKVPANTVFVQERTDRIKMKE